MRYVLSLALPCLTVDDYPDDRWMFGGEILLEGWIGALAGDFFWYANIIFFYVMYRVWVRKGFRVRWLMAPLLALAGCSTLFPALQTHSAVLSIALPVLPGVYVWGVAMLLAACMCVLAPGKSTAPLQALRNSPGSIKGIHHGSV